MISFPGATAVNRILPKEAFYSRLALSKELRERFVSDIKRITLQNSLTATTLHLEPGEQVAEILVLAVDLKRQELDSCILESIARQNPHKLVFLLRYEEMGQLTLFYNKLYCTPWQPLDDLHLSAKGFTLDAVWDGFLEQIALGGHAECGMRNAELTVAERIKRQEAVQKLQKELAKAEKLARAEKQPKKRFELYQQVQELKHQLEVLK